MVFLRIHLVFPKTTWLVLLQMLLSDRKSFKIIHHLHEICMSKLIVCAWCLWKVKLTHFDYIYVSCWSVSLRRRPQRLDLDVLTNDL